MLTLPEEFTHIILKCNDCGITCNSRNNVHSILPYHEGGLLCRDCRRERWVEDVMNDPDSIAKHIDETCNGCEKLNNETCVPWIQARAYALGYCDMKEE